MKTNSYSICNFETLRGTAPPTQKLACFMLYLKIINIFLKYNISYASYSNLSKELKIVSKFR